MESKCPQNQSYVFVLSSKNHDMDKESARNNMVTKQLMARGITDPAVLFGLFRIPRERFLPDSLENQAYEDGPLPIGKGQTISQPYIVACMTEALELTGEERSP